MVSLLWVLLFFEKEYGKVMRVLDVLNFIVGMVILFVFGRIFGLGILLWMLLILILLLLLRILMLLFSPNIE